MIPTLLQLRRQLNATAITPAATGQAVDGLFALFSRSRLPFHLVTRVAPGVAAFKLVESMLEGAGLSTGQLLAARQALPHNVTTNMALELATLARQIDRDERSRAALTTLADAELARWLAGKLPPVLQNGARRFLRRYGHRAVREIDLGVPRWREEPHYLFAVLRSHLDNPNDPTQHFRQQTAAAERAAGAVARQLRGAPGGWYKARVAAWLLRQYRQLGGLREMPKFYIVWGLGEVRRCCQRLGGALVEAGRLDRPADVFFLTFPELRRADFDDLDLRALVQERRAAYEQALRRRRAPRVLADNGEEFHGAAGGSAAQGWQGTAASPGIQRGRVRVVRDPSTPLRAGEVLVAPSTDPAWTPLFLTACALVMEAGGMMSHGSIVAREYGIPAVVGLAGATELLHDGDLVEVDGAAGVVRLLTPAAAVAAP